MGLYAYLLLWLSFAAGVIIRSVHGFDQQGRIPKKFFFGFYALQSLIAFSTGDGNILFSTLVIVILVNALSGLAAGYTDRRVGYEGRWLTAIVCIITAIILTTVAIRVNFPTYREGQTTICLDRIMNRRDVWLDYPRPMTALLRQEPIISFKPTK